MLFGFFPPSYSCDSAKESSRVLLVLLKRLEKKCMERWEIEFKMRNHLKKTHLNIKHLFTQQKRNLGDANIRRMMNVCFFRKAFALNHSYIIWNSQSWGRGCENYKCLTNYKINTKVKPCTKRWTWQASQKEDLSLALFLEVWSSWSRKRHFLPHPVEHMGRNPGKENERPGLCGDVLCYSRPQTFHKTYIFLKK